MLQTLICHGDGSSFCLSDEYPISDVRRMDSPPAESQRLDHLSKSSEPVRTLPVVEQRKRPYVHMPGRDSITTK